ncbi:hypothetical protein HS088_TW06G01266 [Tripterygium wilfordii]|uniref:Uncharacterized protein n=1 Tax=Tripterygium wilfordii TaxID=458696 RepID=A0A7J7DL76_TRIWF|nr:uncharacterized protein LOC119999927 [Tripterygium wilfordii]KAF5747087.1 hypothetical protein HS088_TW06G01266 [Tripterygium wilfordii]
MATTRMLRTSRPTMGHVPSASNSSTSVTTMRLVKAGFHGEKMICGDGIDHQRKSTVAIKAPGAATATGCSTTATVEPKVGPTGIIDVGSLLASVGSAMVEVLRPVVKRRSYWRLHVQMFIERVIVNCRFFTLFAVAGSLLGSTLCFLEGCFTIAQAYLLYFNILSQTSDQGHMVHLLIEAIDMFLVGTAMLIFGVALYVMFVGSKNSNENHQWLPESNLFGLFHFKALPTWAGMESVSEAKSKIGHAVLMILQVGLLEKFKSIPLVTSFDLACFAGAVLISSACIYVLSKLSINT